MAERSIFYSLFFVPPFFFISSEIVCVYVFMPVSVHHEHIWLCAIAFICEIDFLWMLWPFLLLSNKRINVLNDLKAINAAILSSSRLFLSLSFILYLNTCKNPYKRQHFCHPREKHFSVKPLKSNHHSPNGMENGHNFFSCLKWASFVQGSNSFHVYWVKFVRRQLLTIRCIINIVIICEIKTNLRP